MASRKVAEERSIGEALIRDFVLGDVAEINSSLTSSFHLLRMLNEVQDDLTKHSGSMYTSSLSGREDPGRLASVLSVASAVADARVRVADACYSELDVCVNALDRRLKLMDAILKLHGQGMVDEGEMKTEKLVALTRPPDAISSRMRRRPAGEGGSEGGSSLQPSLMIQLAEATGGVSANGKASSPGALDVSIGTFEPRYCENFVVVSTVRTLLLSRLSRSPLTTTSNPSSQVPVTKWPLAKWLPVIMNPALSSGFTWLAWVLVPPPAQRVGGCVQIAGNTKD